MTPWLIFVLGLIPPWAIGLYHACRGSTAGRLVGLQLASIITGFALTALTFALDEPSFIDLALALALLTLPGTLIITLFLERWL